MEDNKDNLLEEKELKMEEKSIEENIPQPVDIDIDTESTVEIKENKVDYEELIKAEKDKYLRLFAEFDNYKKRTAKERIELYSTASKDVILDMISVVDDFERALKENEKSDDLTSIKEGVNLIYDKMYKLLEKKGVKKIESIGLSFNPDYHEAITEIPAANEEQKGKVIDEIEPGYNLNDKPLRFAKVVVGK